MMKMMTLDELIYQLEHLKNRIPFSVYKEKAKYVQALTKSIALLRHLQKCMDLYIDGIKQPIDFDLIGAATNIKPLEQEPTLDKPHIRGDYYDGFKNGLRTAEWRYNKIKAEIEHMIPCGKEALSMKLGVLEILDEYKESGE